MLGRGKAKVTGFKFGTVEVVKAGWRKWRATVKSPSTGALIDHGFLSDYSESDARTWAEKCWEEVSFLAKLQRALGDGKLTPTQYYQIWEKFKADRDGCKQPHTHSLKCKYHPNH